MSTQDPMDIRQQQEMWRNFTRISTWVAGAVVVVLALMAVFLT